jgi:hypothetical protein
MDSNHIASFVLATALWIGLGACALLGGGSIRPGGEFWTSTSSEKIASHPTLMRADYPAMARERAEARRAVIATR